MKTRIVLLVASLVFLGSCATMYCKKGTDFSPKNVQLGMSKEDFIEKFGEPYRQNFYYNDANTYCEELFYKENILTGNMLYGEYIELLSVFLFEEERLVSQTQKEPKNYRAVKVYERIEESVEEKEDTN